MPNQAGQAGVSHSAPARGATSRAVPDQECTMTRTVASAQRRMPTLSGNRNNAQRAPRTPK